nr:lysozyme-like protein 1 [Macaca fascicularis]
MKAAGILTLIGCLVTGAESKIYTRCKLAKIFSRAGLDNYWGFSLGNWICMAYYESGYNTTAQRVLDDGSIDYGIFQINSFTWCRHGKLQENNHCHVACSGEALTFSDAILGTRWPSPAWFYRPGLQSSSGQKVMAITGFTVFFSLSKTMILHCQLSDV